MALDRPFDDGRAQTANFAANVSNVFANIIDDLMFVFTAKRTLYSPRFSLDEAQETGVSDQRGGRKTTELHTRGAKQAETWQAGVEWRELAIGLVVASGDERKTGEEDLRSRGLVELNPDFQTIQAWSEI